MSLTSAPMRYFTSTLHSSMLLYPRLLSSWTARTLPSCCSSKCAYKTSFLHCSPRCIGSSAEDINIQGCVLGESLHNSSNALSLVADKHNRIAVGRSAGKRARPGKSSRGGSWGWVGLAGSPLLFTDWQEKNPKSELIFMAGKAMDSVTQRFLENEYGQSIFLCFVFATSVMFMYHSMKIRRFVFDMKHKYAPVNLIVGHPLYMARSVPPNPLVRSTKAS
eukprot:GHVQ01000027.1.p1 GENE.GHVQ01000027.1~~GHVQ01000027.1.p1  ORF type:complete len:220 (-),score=16.03 GHVQ01000027.1:635-1294(-)